MSGAGGRSPLLAAVDVGTTGARAMAIDLDGRVVAEVRRGYPTRSPHPGWAEQDPRDWGDRALEALAGLGARSRVAPRIVGIGLTGQCPTIAPFDARGRPVGPGLIYRDNRAAAEADLMRRTLGARRLHRRTGHTAEAFHVGPKLLWLRSHRPDVFSRTARFLAPRDVVARRLTGREATDETHANATLFYDLRERCWAPDLFDAFDLDPGIFPRALPPWEVLDSLRARTASTLGLPAGIPVVIGAADSQCVAFGASTVDPGPISEMAGASSCLNSAVLAPLDDPRVTHYSHVVPDRYCTELGLNTTGAAVDWAIDRLGYVDHAAFIRDAAAFRRRMLVRRGADDVRELAPLFLPYLGDGERDDPTIRAGFVGLSSRHARAALAFAVFEGIALGIRSVVEVLREAGSPTEELRVGGGAARLGVLGQIKADALAIPVLHLDGDASAVGTALLAAAAAGLGSEVAHAQASFLARGRRFRPSRAGLEAIERRARWFEEVRSSPEVHLGGGS